MKIKLQDTYQSTAEANTGAAESIKDQGQLQPMVPSNIFSSAANNRNMLQVVFVAIFLGVGLIQIPKKSAQPVLNFLMD